MRTAILVLGLCLLLTLPACQMNERLSGTLFGAGGGALLGVATSGPTGLLVGGLVGGLAGYLVGDYVADQRERGRRSVFRDTSGGQVAGIKEYAPPPPSAGRNGGGYSYSSTKSRPMRRGAPPSS